MRLILSTCKSLAVITILLVGCGKTPNPSAQPDMETSTLPVQLLWFFDTKETIKKPPYYADGTVYAYTQDNLLYAIDALEGTLRWVQEADVSEFQFNSIISEDKVILAKTNRFIEVRSTANGKVLWRKELDARAIAAGDGKVFVAIDRLGGRIEAYDLTTGDRLWQYAKTQDLTEGSGVYYDSLAQEVISPGIILDAETGALKATFHTPEMPGYPSSYVAKYENGRIFYGSYTHDIRTNTLVFKDANYRNINAYLTTSLVDNIHFLYGRSGFVALDVTTFTPKWTQYEGDFGHLLVKARIVSNVTILDGVVYLIFSDATLRALALEDGHEIGRWQAENVVYSGDIKIIPGLARSGEMIFVTFGENRVYAFGGE